MKIQLKHLVLRAKRATVQINFSEVVTFLHGPVSTGKSTVARLVDYCLGGELERTPAIQSEFVAAELSLILGDFNCTLERASEDTQYIRVTFVTSGPSATSINCIWTLRFSISKIRFEVARLRMRCASSPVFIQND